MVSNFSSIHITSQKDTVECLSLIWILSFYCLKRLKTSFSLGRKSVSIRPGGETLHLLNVCGSYIVPDVQNINNALTQNLFLKL